MTVPDEPPASTSPNVSPSLEPTLSAAELRSLADFLEDISVAFEVLYLTGDITAAEYLTSILAGSDGFLEESTSQNSGPAI